MSDDLKCPQNKLIRLMVCSQGTEGGQCPHDKNKTIIPDIPADWFGRSEDESVFDTILKYVKIVLLPIERDKYIRELIRKSIEKAISYNPKRYINKLECDNKFYIAESKDTRGVIDIHAPSAYTTLLRLQYIHVSVPYDQDIEIKKYTKNSIDVRSPATSTAAKAILKQRKKRGEIIERDELSEAAKTIRYWPVIIEDPAD